MNIRWNSSWALAALLMVGGCGMSGGRLLYMFGVGRSPLVQAKFDLTQGPVLILVDDVTACVDWPPTSQHLIDELSQQLIKKKAAGKIVPRQTLEHLRQSEVKFERRGCREIGVLAGAEQVIWVEVRDFLAQEQIFDTTNAAYFSVTVKVISCLETRRSRVRLWPRSPNGHPVTVSMTGSEVAREKTKSAIARELSRRLAVELTKLFHDHRLGDFERE